MATSAPDALGTPPAKRRQRSHETRKSVLIVDRIADWTITVGGLLVIVAVLGIMVFLAQVVVPLFTGATMEGQIQRTFPAGPSPVVTASTDDYRTVALTLAQDGTVAAYHIPTGTALPTQKLDFAGVELSAVERTINWEDLAFGFADGTIRFGRVAIKVDILTAAQVPANLKKLDHNDLTDGTAIYSPVPGDQVRKLSIVAEIEDVQKVSEAGKPIVAVDYHRGGTSERPTKTFVSVDADGVVRLSRSESRKNIMTGQVRTSTDSAVLPELPAGLKVARVLTTDAGDQVYVADRGGLVYRFDTRDFRAPVLAETTDLIAGNAELSDLSFLIGEQSLVVTASDGSVNIYFRLPEPTGGTKDGFRTVRVHTTERHKAAVTQYSPSQRTKLFVTADAQGEIWVRHATSEQTVLKLPKAQGIGGYRTVLLTPRDDGVLAIDEQGRGSFWYMAVPHPETTLKSIFGKVWYEGYDGPTYTWQSSAGTDSFEPKLSLIPLIFGTIKATIYALLFAVPIALLAAIYTSEFVHPRVRAGVKPVMEMMASLPSVVLGFIAALILAPIVETWIAAVLMVFVALPLSLVFSAYLWQLLPQDLAIRLQGLPKFALMFVVLGLAFWLCYSTGPYFERIFFAGDLKGWANGDIGSGASFLFLMLLPLSMIVVIMLSQRFIGEWLLGTTRSLGGVRSAAFDLARWVVMLVSAAALSAVVSGALTSLGYDPRGGVVSTYVQRNTLIVGFAMGFAVIPIIYTIAEDALNSVPEHLRAASLACGATPWQTAMSVILPTAISGVFAAVMIGMGRAVGETMIVVMAAGNTPILDWNIFNGLRALSANIAVELPEAVKDSTLYRMLFLAAFTLFVMTFVVNTVAEIIRQRFRKRAVAL
jgi:phosphate transport system permease protein